MIYHVVVGVKDSEGAKDRHTFLIEADHIPHCLTELARLVMRKNLVESVEYIRLAPSRTELVRGTR